MTVFLKNYNLYILSSGQEIIRVGRGKLTTLNYYDLHLSQIVSKIKIIKNSIYYRLTTYLTYLWLYVLNNILYTSMRQVLTNDA